MKLNARMNNEGGFSLVELMVVVAIIGILATVAIPSVSKYMMKARQSEVKANLASLYSAEKAFSVEYGQYASFFNVVGHSPEGTIRYDYGFDVPTTVAQFTGMGYNTTAAALTGANYINSAGAGCTLTAAQLNTGTVTSAAGLKCTMAKESRAGGVIGGAALGAPTIANIVYGNNPQFIAAGQAIMNPNAATTIDEWTINHNKVLNNSINGL